MSTANERWNYNDMVLLGSLVYCSVDLTLEWDNFGSCSKPLQKWLLVSFFCVIAFRGVHLAGSYASAAEGNQRGDFLLDLRFKGKASKLLATLTWTMFLPFFAAWTMLGSSWFWKVWRDTPYCMPSQTHFWFAGFWLLVCYGWIFVHMGLGVAAFLFELRVQRAEGSLREIEDDDVRQRWGNVSHIADYREMVGDACPVSKVGLTPAEIKSLRCEVAATILPCDGDGCRRDRGKRECSICLCDMEPEDLVRPLPGCEHCFHKSCIDLWLLRRADCPLCKRAVRGQSSQEHQGCKGEWV